MITSKETKNIYQGDGVTTQFPFTFDVDSESKIRVFIHDEQKVIEEELLESNGEIVINRDSKTVTVNGRASELASTGKTQIPLNAGERIAVVRETTAIQNVDLGNNYPLSTIERLCDRVTLLVQELMEKLDRTIKTTITESASPENYAERINQSILNGLETARNTQEIALNAAAQAQAVQEQITAVADNGKRVLENLKGDLVNEAAAAKQQVVAATTAGIKEITDTWHNIQEKLGTVDGLAPPTKNTTKYLAAVDNAYLATIPAGSYIIGDTSVVTNDVFENLLVVEHYHLDVNDLVYVTQTLYELSNMNRVFYRCFVNNGKDAPWREI